MLLENMQIKYANILQRFITKYTNDKKYVNIIRIRNKKLYKCKKVRNCKKVCEF